MECSVNPTRLVDKIYNEENELPQHKIVNNGTAFFVLRADRITKLWEEPLIDAKRSASSTFDNKQVARVK